MFFSLFLGYFLNKFKKLALKLLVIEPLLRINCIYLRISEPKVG